MFALSNPEVCMLLAVIFAGVATVLAALDKAFVTACLSVAVGLIALGFLIT